MDEGGVQLNSYPRCYKVKGVVNEAHTLFQDQGDFVQPAFRLFFSATIRQEKSLQRVVKNER